MQAEVAQVEVADVKVKTETADSDYVVKNPKSTGCQTALSGGATLNEWDIEDEKFYNNEGKQIGTPNLWASIPNLLMGFAVWLMWSVTIAKIQKAHTTDPSVYYFKDFAPADAPDGFRGCPGWYDEACCSTWKDAPAADFEAWQASANLAENFATADAMMMSLAFKSMSPSPAGANAMGFSNYSTHGVAYGCAVSGDRKKQYKSVTYVIGATAGLSGGIFRLPNSFIVPLVGGRNVVYFPSILLANPCVWAAIALSNPNVSAIMVVLAAMFSGVGGGSFA